MNPPTKIQKTDIARIQHLLVETPEYRPDSVTKRQVVAELLPQIARLQGTGYTVEAIAAQRSAHGLPMSRAVLQRYLREVKSEPRSKKPRAKRRTSDDRAKRLPTDRIQGATDEANGLAHDVGRASSETAQWLAGDASHDGCMTRKGALQVRLRRPVDRPPSVQRLDSEDV